MGRWVSFQKTMAYKTDDQIMSFENTTKADYVEMLVLQNHLAPKDIVLHNKTLAKNLKM